MSNRTTQIASLRIREHGDDGGGIVISQIDLQADTDATPANPTVTMAAGYDRRAGRQYDIVVAAATPQHFAALDAFQRAGTTVDIQFNHTDGSSVEYLDVGFTVQEQQFATFGEGLEGFLLNGTASGINLTDMITLTPELGDGDGDGD